jgi:ketosteroid isomerase-like protein
MAVRENEAAVRRTFEAWNGDETAADAIGEDCVYHDPSLSQPARGREAIVEVIRSYRRALSDLRVELHEMVSDGDLVAARWSATGKDRSGNTVRTDGLALNRLRDGLVVEGWSHWTMATRP